MLATGRQGPLVILVEDLHWIDHTSEAYLASLIERLSGAAILLLATYRPGYRPPWLDRSYRHPDRAPPARRPRTASRWSAGSCREAAGADPVARLILDKAEGNPFFLEELARVVVDQRAGRGGPRGAGHRARRAHRAHRPLGGGSQAARADGRSVLGREFPLRLLQAVEPRARPATSGPHLAELSRLEFLYERTEAGEPVYVFKHALTQDVARATLVAARRQELHRRAADALQRLYPERVRELAPRARLPLSGGRGLAGGGAPCRRGGRAGAPGLRQPGSARALRPGAGRFRARGEPGSGARHVARGARRGARVAGGLRARADRSRGGGGARGRRAGSAARAAGCWARSARCGAGTATMSRGLALTRESVAALDGGDDRRAPRGSAGPAGRHAAQRRPGARVPERARIGAPALRGAGGRARRRRGPSTCSA